MPVVPRRTPQVRTAALPGVRVQETAPIEAFGGGQGLNQTFGAAQDLLGTATNFAIKEKQRADEVAVLDADYQLAQKQSAREQELDQYRGKAALEGAEKIKTAWESDVTEIRRSLKSDDQRAAYDRKVFARNLQINDYRNKYVSTNLEKHDRDQTDAFIVNAQNEASRNAYDPERIQASLIQQNGAIQQYAARTGEAPALTQKKIEDAARQTHLSVVDRLIADGDYDRAEAYVTDAAPVLTGDQVRSAKSLIESGRRREEQRLKEDRDNMERDLYLKTLDGEVGLKDIRGLLDNGVIDIPFYDKLRSRIVKVNNDPEIPNIEKTERLFEILKRFDGLKGAKVDSKKLSIKKPAKGNHLDDLKAFRDFVTESAGHLTEKQERALLNATQQNFDDAMAGKIGVFSKVMNFLSDSFSKSPDVVAPFAGAIVSKMMDSFDPSVTVQKAAENAAQLHDEATIAVNPNRTRFAVGQIITNANGIDFKVIGFDESGNPRLDLVR